MASPTSPRTSSIRPSGSWRPRRGADRSSPSCSARGAGRRSCRAPCSPASRGWPTFQPSFAPTSTASADLRQQRRVDVPARRRRRPSRDALGSHGAARRRGRAQRHGRRHRLPPAHRAGTGDGLPSAAPRRAANERRARRCRAARVMAGWQPEYPGLAAVAAPEGFEIQIPASPGTPHEGTVPAGARRVPPSDRGRTLARQARRRDAGEVRAAGARPGLGPGRSGRLVRESSGDGRRDDAGGFQVRGDAEERCLPERRRHQLHSERQRARRCDRYGDDRQADEGQRLGEDAR